MTRIYLRRAWADIRTGPWQSALTVVVVAAATATLILAAVVQRSAADPYERLFDRANGAHVVFHADSRVDLDPIARLQGVLETAGPIPVLGCEDLRRGADRHCVNLVGTASSPEVARPLVVEGRWLSPGATDEIVLERGLARSAGVEVGDEVTIDPARFTVVGIAVISHRGAFPGDQPGTTYVDPAALDRVDREEPRFNWYGVRLDDPAATEAFIGRAREAVGSELFAIRWQQIRGHYVRSNVVNAVLAGVFGLVALVAAGFIVATTISGRVLDRYRDLGILKAVGLTPRQVAVGLMAHYLLLGLAGWTLGVGASLLIAPPIVGSLARLFAVPAPSTLDPLVLGGALVAVQGAIALFALLPAWRGGRVPPVRAIRVGFARPRSRPSTAARVASRIGLGPVALLGVREAFARPLRAARTIAALVITIGGAVFALTFLATFDSLIGEPALRGEADALVFPADDLDPVRAERILGAEPGVAAFFEEGTVGSRVGEDPARIDTDLYRGDYASAGFNITEGRMFSGPREIIAGHAFLERFGLSVGDRVTLRLILEGEDENAPEVLRSLPVTVVGRYVAFEDSGLVVATDAANVPEVASEPFGKYNVVLDEDADPEDVKRSLMAASGGRMDVSLQAGDVPEEMRATKSMLAGLVAVLVAITLLNLLAATSITVREHARDFGTLKALGMTPRQVGGVVAVGVSVLALVAGVIAVPAGAASSGALFDAVGRSVGIGPGYMVLPSVLALALVFPAGAIVAVAGAAIPARRAARVSVPGVMRYE